MRIDRRIRGRPLGRFFIAPRMAVVPGMLRKNRTRRYDMGPSRAFVQGVGQALDKGLDKCKPLRTNGLRGV